MKNNIQQTVFFSGTPHQVFEALMDEKKHGSFTNASAKIDRKVGGKFSVWDGYATGETKDLKTDKKIVQFWRADDWPKDVKSIVTFELFLEKNKTKLVFTQNGIPKSFVEDIKKGWQDYYWKPLEKFLIKNEK